MRFIFATDIHGNHDKYRHLLKVAPELGAAAIVIGGDIAPKLFCTDPFKAQLKWYKWMAKKADEQVIPVYTFLGNDDIKCLMHDFIDICNISKNLNYLRTKGMIEGVSYKMYNWVPDYPFGLKDWCKLDKEGWPRPPYLGVPVLSENKSFKTIKDVKKHFNDMSTIEKDLEHVYRADMAFMHAPPACYDLDVCADGSRVGSHAILDWIEREQPIASFHGHIHESPRMTGVWKVKIGETLAVQPGDRDFVIVDIDPDKKTVDVQCGNY